MNRIIKNIELDLDRQQMNSEVTAHVKQTDNNSRELVLTLRVNNTERQVQPDEHLRLRLKKADGKAIYADLPSSTDGKVHVILTDEMLSCSGLAKADIEVSSGETILSSFMFYLDVEERVLSEDSIIDTDEYGVLQSLISSAESAIEECESAAEGVNEAKDAANTAATGANAAKDAANAAATEANDAASKANTQADAAQTGAAAANSAASAANTAAERANKAAEAVEGLDVSQLVQQITELEESKVDKASLADYVEEEGSIEEWRYRKWHGGTAECWARIRTPVALESTGIEGIYKGVVNLELPTGLFTDTPVVTGGVIQHFNNWCAIAGSDASHAVIAYFQTNQNGNNTERAFDLYATGRWLEEPDPDVPTYVTEAADDLASRIQNHLSGSSYYLRLAFPTDLHCGWYEDPENVSVTHAGQALKRLRPRLDAVIGGGDYTTGSASTTAESAAEDITAGLTLLDMAGMGEDGLPYFFVLGNHDDAPYRATEDRVNEEAMNLLFALAHLKSGFTMADSPLYGYRDFEGAKIRVICLNTRDTFGWESDETSSGYTAYVDVLHLGAEQLGWLVNTALDFSGKSDAEEWGIIVCSHAPLNVNDTGYKGHTYNTANGMAILSAYRQGASGSVTSDGEEVPYDFTSSPRAQVICCIHGHRHNYEDETVDGILSVGCPNVMDGRERESDDGQTYTKTEDSAEDTSFCVISIDRTNGKIYADHYGAGYDRVWEYTEPEPGPGYTNQIPISTDESGGIYNGTGYKTGVRLNSSGEETEATSSITSGFIPFKPGDVLRVQGGRWTGSGNSYIQLYNAEKKLILPINYGHMSDTAYGKTEFSASDTSVEREMKYTMTGVTIKPGSGLDPADTKFVRISCSWTDGNTLIATVNEEIT